MKKSYLIGLLAVTILGFFVLSFIVPQVAQESALKRRQLDSLLLLEKRAPILANELSSKSEEIKRLKQAFPKKEELVLVVKWLESLAFQRQVLATLHFESEEVSQDEHGSAFIPVSITVEGEYDGLIGLLENLHKGSYFFVWESIEGVAQSSIKKVNTITLRGKLYASKN